MMAGNHTEKLKAAAPSRTGISRLLGRARWPMFTYEMDLGAGRAHLIPSVHGVPSTREPKGPTEYAVAPPGTDPAHLGEVPVASTLDEAVSLARDPKRGDGAPTLSQLCCLMGSSRAWGGAVEPVSADEMLDVFLFSPRAKAENPDWGAAAFSHFDDFAVNLRLTPATDPASGRYEVEGTWTFTPLLSHPLDELNRPVALEDAQVSLSFPDAVSYLSFWNAAADRSDAVRDSIRSQGLPFPPSPDHLPEASARLVEELAGLLRDSPTPPTFPTPEIPAIGEESTIEPERVTRR